MNFKVIASKTQLAEKYSMKGDKNKSCQNSIIVDKQYHYSQLWTESKLCMQIYTKNVKFFRIYTPPIQQVIISNSSEF